MVSEVPGFSAQTSASVISAFSAYFVFCEIIGYRPAKKDRIRSRFSRSVPSGPCGLPKIHGYSRHSAILPHNRPPGRCPRGFPMDKLDLIDRKILAELMRDATLSVAQIADRVGLSQTPCWKRIQKLEAAGIITGRVALVDPERIGFGLTVFVGVEAPDHGSAWRQSFAEAVAKIPAILEVYRMAGDTDY